MIARMQVAYLKSDTRFIGADYHGIKIPNSEQYGLSDQYKTWIRTKLFL